MVPRKQQRVSVSDRRRHFLGRLARAIGFSFAITGLGIGGGRALAQEQEEELPHLKPDDPTAKALMYVTDAEDADPALRETNEFCHNCRYFKGEDDQKEGWAGCEIFPEHVVSTTGWCNVWAEKT